MGVNTIFPRQFIDTEETGIGVLNFININKKIGNISDAKTLIKEIHKQSNFFIK